MRQRGIAPIMILLVVMLLMVGGALFAGFRQTQKDIQKEKEIVEGTPAPTAAETNTPTPTPQAVKTATPTKKAVAKTTTPSGTPVYGSFASPAPSSGPDCSMYNTSGQKTDIKIVTCPESGSLTYSPIGYVQTQNGCKILDNNYTDKLSVYVTTTLPGGCKEGIIGNLPPGPYNVWVTIPTGTTVGSQSASAVFGSVTTVTFTVPPTYSY